MTDSDIERAITDSLAARAHTYPARREDPATLADVPTARAPRIRPRPWWVLAAIPAAAALAFALVGSQPISKTRLHVGNTPPTSVTPRPAPNGGPPMPNNGSAKRQCLAVSAAVAATLSGLSCGGSTTASSSSTTAPAATPTTIAGTSAQSATPGSPPPSTPTSTSPAGGTAVTACSASQLAISIPHQQGAGGHYLIGFLVKNNGTSPCAIGGYFGVSLYDTTGSLITDQDNRLAPPYSNTPQPVTVAPGGDASFQTNYIENPQNLPCQSVGSIHLIPPNSTSTISLADSGHYCPPSGITVSATTAGS